MVASSYPGLASGRGYPVRIDEVMAGANGDPRVEFIELRVAGRQLWGPQRQDWDYPRPRAILTFHDATGMQTGVFEFPTDPAPRRAVRGRHGRPILIATRAFEERTGLKPDFEIPPLLHALAGMVCFRDDPSNAAGPQVHACLSYGNYVGPPQVDACGIPTGPPAPALPTAGQTVQSLSRRPGPHRGERFGCSSRETSNADFALGPATPRNSTGLTAELAPRPLAEQGESVFSLETFEGNGRTCATCHPAAGDFALTPEAVAERFAADPSDPLFVAERDLELSELENTCLLREGHERALVLENVAGFDRAPVFRNSPHLLNIESTAPYGLAGGFGDLQSFCVGAIRQHFPRTLARNSDPASGPLDFRESTDFELEAMEAFMQSIRFPSDGDLDLEAMIEAAIAGGADEPAIRRGEDLFFGDAGRAQCFRCHSGPVLSEADGSLGAPGSQAFDIGVASRVENLDDGCAGGPGDPDAPLPPDRMRFSTPPLVGVARTGPFFHDNSAPDLRSAVFHYTTAAFRFSEAGLRMEFIPIRLTDPEIDDLVAFLEAISVDPALASEP